MFDYEKECEALKSSLMNDERFVKALERKDKSLQGFMKYFWECVKAEYIKRVGQVNGYADHIEDSEVQSLMLHYWTEDNPKVGDISLASVQCKKVEQPKPAAKPAKTGVKVEKPIPMPSKPKAKAAIPVPKVEPKVLDLDDDFDIF